MGGCTSTTLNAASEKKFRRAIKLYEVAEVNTLTNFYNRNKCFATGESPLTLAAGEGHEAVVDVLISSGANVNQVDKNGRVPLHIAVQFNDEETVDILLAAKANPNKYDGYNMTPLHIACERGYKKMVKKLLDAGVDPNSDQRGIPPLVYCVFNAKSDCLEVLLKHGNAEPNVLDARGNTALHIAVCNKDIPSSKLLLEYKADPHLPSRDNDTLVCLAALTSCPGTLQALIDIGCDINAHKEDEPPAVLAAAARGSSECMDILLASHVELDVQDKKGQTALYACVLGVLDPNKEMYYSKYFSNVYRLYSKYDPLEIVQENSTKCAMSLVQAGANVTQIWDKFVQVFPNPSGISFEQMVLCEVLIQAFGFEGVADSKIRPFVAVVIHLKEYGLMRLIYSAGLDPTWKEAGTLGMSQEESDRDMFKWVKGLRSNPRQLKDLCRKKVRQLCSWNVLYSVEVLDISQDIKEYICIMDTDHYSR